MNVMSASLPSGLLAAYGAKRGWTYKAADTGNSSTGAAEAAAAAASATEAAAAAETQATPEAAPANEHKFDTPYSHEAAMTMARAERDVRLELANHLPPVRRFFQKVAIYTAFSWKWLKSAVKAAVHFTKDKIRQAYNYVVTSKPVAYVTDKIRAAYEWIKAKLAAGQTWLRNKMAWYAYVCDKAHQGVVAVKKAAVWTKDKIVAGAKWAWAKLGELLSWIGQGFAWFGNHVIEFFDWIVSTVRGWFGGETTSKAKSTAAAVATAAVVGAAAATGAAAAAPAATTEAPVAAAASEQGVQFNADAIVPSTDAAKCTAFFNERFAAANRDVPFNKGWGNEEDGFSGLIAGEAALSVSLNPNGAPGAREMNVTETLRAKAPNGQRLIAVGTRMGPVVVFERQQAGQFGICAGEDLIASGVFYQQGEMTVQDLQVVLGAAPQGNEAAQPNLGERVENIFGKLIKATPDQM